MVSVLRDLLRRTAESIKRATCSCQGKYAATLTTCLLQCHSLHCRFYFAIMNTRKGQKYKFNAINLMKEDSLYSTGMLPLIHSEITAAESARKSSKKHKKHRSQQEQEQSEHQQSDSSPKHKHKGRSRGDTMDGETGQGESVGWVRGGEQVSDFVIQREGECSFRQRAGGWLALLD